MCAPQVMEAAVIGIPHPKWSERPLLIAVPNPKQPPSKDELLGFLKVRTGLTDQLAPHEIATMAAAACGVAEHGVQASLYRC